MKVNREIALELMALVDGELEGQAKERAERRLETHEHAREVMSQMRDGRTRAWLKDSMEGRALHAGADGIAESVLAEIVGSVRERDRFERPSGRPSGRAIRFRRDLGRVVMVALALAAAVALVVGYRAAFHEGPRSAQHSGAAEGAPAAASGVELDEIDSPAHDVSVFEISGATAALATNSPPTSSVVIWIEDEPGVQ